MSSRQLNLELQVPGKDWFKKLIDMSLISMWIASKFKKWKEAAPENYHGLTGPTGKGTLKP